MPSSYSDLRLEASPEGLEQALRDLVRATPTDPGAAMRAVLESGVEALHAEAATLWVLTDDESRLVCRHRYSAAGGHEALVGELPADQVRDRLDRLRQLRVDVAPGGLPGASATTEAAIEAAAWCGSDIVGVLRVERAAGEWGWPERFFVGSLAEHASRELERELNVRANRALRERERWIDEMEQVGHLGSWEWDLTTRQVWWSPEHLRIHGLTEEQSPKDFEGFLRTVHPDDYNHVVSVARRLDETGEPFSIAYRIVRPDGAVRQLLTQGRLMPDETGEIRRMVGTSQDVTERARTEEALRSSELRFRDMFEQYPQSVQIVAPDGHTLQVNESYTRLFGFRLEDLSGFNLLTDPQLESLRDLMVRGFAGEVVSFPPLLYDGRFIGHASGSDVEWPRWIDSVMFPLRDVDGRVRELVLVHRDVTEQKTAEEALRASEESYRTIFKYSSDAIWVHDLESGAFLEVNDAACEMYGYTVEETKALGVPGISWGEEPFTVERAREFMELAVAGVPQRFEWLGRHREGHKVWNEVQLRRVTIGGEDRLLATARDINARKLAEADILRAKDELERRVVERTAELAATNEALEEEIAEHEAAKEELLERTRELEGVFEALPDQYMRVTRDLLVLDARVGEGICPLDRYVGSVLTDVIPAEYRERLVTPFEEVNRTGERLSFEFQDVTGEETRDFEARILPLADGTLIWLGREITGRKRAERTLQEREEHFRKLIENTSDIITILDAQATVQYQSPALGRMLGYAHGELNGRNVFELVHPDDIAATVEAFSEVVLFPGTNRTATYRFRHADGSWRVLESTGRTMSPDSGEEGVIINSRDVTERTEAEEALRFQTTLLETQNDAAIDGILVAHQGRVLSMNARYAELFRVPEELRSLDRCHEMFDWCVQQAADPVVYRETVARLRADPETVHRDEVLLADGRVFDRYSSPLVGPDGTFYGRIWVIRDITERMQTEAALRQAKDEAERANRAKSEFLSRMSHELRTPMNSILGFAQLLGRADLPPQQTKSVQHILKAGRHLLNLINEVLEISRIEAGRQNFSLEPVRLSSVAQEAVALVRPLAAQWAVQVEESIGSSSVFVMADRQRLVQVLLNLLSNAIKYNRPGGKVRLVCAPAGAGEYGVRVEDTGRGIPAELQDQLFTPFARLGAEQTEVEGTGLGLALSLRLAEAMGGSLALVSSDPTGSAFLVTLDVATDPAAALDEEAVAAAVSSEVGNQPATLLYIEDNLANLSLVETILLSRPAWRTLPALQGQLGIELARQHLPELILLDLHLPDISGEEVLRRLRADERTAHIPVVIVSADATQSSLDRLHQAGANAYLTKPLDLDEFLATVDGFLKEGPP